MDRIVLDKKTENVCFSLGALATAFLLIKSTSYLFSSKSKNEIPIVPYKIPFLGSTLNYYRNTLEFTKKYSEKYGSVFRMHLHGQIVIVVGADHASEVFTHPNLSFLAGQVEFLGRATASKESTKDILSPDIVKKSIVKHLTPNLEKYNPESFKMLTKHVKTLLNVEEGPVVIPNLTPFLLSIVARYSARAFVGKELCDDQNLMDAFENSVTDIGKEMTPGLFRVIFPTFNKYYMKLVYPSAVSITKHRSLIKTALQGEIERKKSNPSEFKETSGIFAYILEEHPVEIDDDFLESITTIILIFIFVGVHTTSMAATQVIYQLIKHPEYIEELLQEQKDIIGDKDTSSYTPAAYRQMVKLDSFIRETMRTRNTGIGLPHKNITQNDIVLKSGAIIHPGESVYINMYHIHMDESNQHMENTEEFQGFRFVGKDKTVTKPSNDFMSFGIGRNACPGRWFAIQQIMGIVSFFITNYHMSAASEIFIPGANGYAGPFKGSVKFQKRI